MSRLLLDTPQLTDAFPAQSRRLRLGVVGGGRISKTQAMAARMTDRWEIVAGALSSDPKKSVARAKEWFIDPERVYSSFEEMAEKESQRSDGVDAVMITTPNHLHYAAARAFLTAGIDVLCDKPLTNELSEAQELLKLASTSGLIFSVCYTMSCYPMIREAKSIVASGKIGAINQIHVEFLQDWMTTDASREAPHVKWRLDPQISGPTSCVGDIGTHAAHLAQFVSGLSLTDVKSEFHICGSPKPLEDTAFMFTRYNNSVPGTLMATRLAPGNRGGLRLRIFGSQGGIEWDMENCEKLKLSIFGEPDRTLSRGIGDGLSKSTERLVRTGRGFPEGLIEAWGNLYSEFAIAIAARRDGIKLPEGFLKLPSLTEGVHGVAFIEASVRSNNIGGDWVAITDIG